MNSKKYSLSIIVAGILFISSSAFAQSITGNKGVSDIINISEQLNKVYLDLDENLVKNAIVLFDKGILDSSFVKTKNGINGEQIEKNGKVIGVCLKFNTAGGALDNKYIPDEMDKLQLISQIFDKTNQTYNFKRRIYGKSNFKKANEASISKDIIIYTSKINNFKVMSRNGRPFKCASNGEAIDKSQWDKDWWGNITAKNYLDKKDIMSQNNHFVYTVDKYHETLSNFVRENTIQKNPMNFIVYPVLTENILATDIPKDFATYDPYKERVEYVYDNPVTNSKFKINDSELERKAIGNAIGTNRDKLISYINSYNGLKPIAQGYLSPDLLSAEQQQRRSYEDASDDVSTGISEYLKTSTNTELIREASNININADAFVTPYCLWKNTTVNFDLLFQEQPKPTDSTKTDYPTKGLDPKYTNPFKYARFAPGVNLNWNIYSQSLGGSSSGLKPEDTQLYKEARSAVNLAFNNLGDNPHNYNSSAGFFPCIINESVRFINLQGKALSEYNPDDSKNLIYSFKSSFAPTVDGKAVYSRLTEAPLKRMASAGSFILKEGGNVFKKLKYYRDAKTGEMSNAKFKKLKKFYENFFSKKNDKSKPFINNKIVIQTKKELAKYIKKYLELKISSLISDRMHTYKNAMDELYAKTQSTDPTVQEKIKTLEREQNLLKVEDVVEANRILVEKGFTSQSGTNTGVDVIDKTFNVKNNILKEKLFGYNEVDRIMPFNRKYDASFNSNLTGGGYTKDQLWNNRTGTSILFDSGDMYLRFSSHSFGGVMACTNHSPCPLNQTAFRKDGTPSITVIGKTAYGNLLKKTINNSIDSTEDSIFVMNSYMKGKNIVPFIGRFNSGQDLNGNKIYETKFYLIYFFKKNLDSLGNNAEIVYTIKPYGYNLELDDKDMTYGALKTSENAIALKDIFDLDFKKNNVGKMLDFQFFNAGQFGFSSENLLTETNFKTRAETGDMTKFNFPIYGLNRKFSNVVPKSKVSNDTIYTKMRYIPNNFEKTDYRESNYVPLNMGESIGPKTMGKKVQTNGSIYWGDTSDEENDYSIFRFNDNGIITNVNGMHSKASDGDYFAAEKVGIAGINSFQVGSFDTYVSRKDDKTFKYPSALYRGMFLLNSKPLNKDSKYTSSYWRNGTTDGVPFKLFRQPTFDLSFGAVTLQCNQSIYAPYEHIVEGIFDINTGKCNVNGQVDSASNYERIGFLCRKTEYLKPSISINGNNCKIIYVKDLRVKQDVKCMNGVYDPKIGACYRPAVEQTINSCPNGYVKGDNYGLFGKCIRLVEDKSDKNFDPNKCSYSSEKDATFSQIENATYIGTCLNSEYTFINGICAKDRAKNLGIGCKTINGTLQTGNMFVVKNKNIIKDNCWGGAKIEGTDTSATLTCPSFNNIPKSTYPVGYSSGNYVGLFNNVGYKNVPEISSQISCPGSINKNWSKEILCGSDGVFDSNLGICTSDFIASYNQCPAGKIPFYDGTISNGKEIRRCGIPECPSGFTVNGTKCVKCK